MVTDEMVEKAERVYWDASNDPEGARDMRAAIEAALSAAEPVGWFNLPNDAHGYQQVAKEFERKTGTIPLYAAIPALPVTVKELQWDEDGDNLKARMGDREWMLNVTSDGKTWAGSTRPFVFGRNLTWSSVPNCSMVSLEAAKAACQADCQARYAALSAQVQDVASSGGMEFPEALTDDLRDVLSTMLWTSGQIAACLRAGGDQIKRRAEDEQAHVLHWLISLALKHGPEWRAKASERIKAIRDAAAPAKQEG